MRKFLKKSVKITKRCKSKVKIKVWRNSWQKSEKIKDCCSTNVQIKIWTNSRKKSKQIKDWCPTKFQIKIWRNSWKKMNRLKTDAQQTSKMRQEETLQERQERLKTAAERMANLRLDRQNEIVPLYEVVNFFLNKVKRAADYICCCCNRLMYECGVVIFNENKYQVDFIDQICEFRKVSVDGKEWICRNCHICLKRGKLPSQA